jgi:UDP-N-acetylmuramoyl-L-alanyl-D-glutamate--2,6-diaminopimelate ligase
MKIKYLNEILDRKSVLGGSDIPAIPISQIDYDSRKTGEGSLFIAIGGYKSDGHRFLPEAARRGAAAAIVERPDDTINIPQFRVENSRLSMARIAANFYREEISKMRLIGITGTNGKTTTSFLIKSILESAGLSCGLIGTIYYDIGGKTTKAWNTTPESADICRFLYQMYNAGQSACVLEVSSHGLVLHRVSGLLFDAGVFTNLTQDHLDFHTDMEDYFQAKKILFTHLRPDGSAIINTADPYGSRLAKDITQDLIDFAPGGHETAVNAIGWQSSIKGLDFIAKTPLGPVEIHTSLIGDFNVENILAAIAAGIAMKFDLKTIRRGIQAVGGIPGRLETFRISGDRTAVVDYSHTPDSLKKSLLVLQQLTKNHLWVIFGCGGDRDRAKRPMMGRIAGEIADRIIVTSDNPRSEDPKQIIDDILQGMTVDDRVYVEPDRREAIYYGLRNAEAGDTILLAGKGHEDYQEIAGIRHSFDDRKVVEGFFQ